MQPLRAYSLVEILVVIALLVMLTAVITSALDETLYRAELAICASRLHAMSTGSITYATTHKRRYPYRRGVEDGDWEPHKLYQVMPGRGPYDERPMIKDYIPLDAMLDPLCQKVSIGEGQTDPQDIVFRNYHQWAGFKWFGHEGMLKIGDRLTWVDDVNYAPARTFRFTLLASDRDTINLGQALVDSSHPDAEGLLVSMKWQSEDVSGGFGLLADTLIQTTYSGWYRLGEASRGKSDLNFAYDDASVQRIDSVLDRDDPRMTGVPHFANPAGVPTVGTWPSQFDNVPKP